MSRRSLALLLADMIDCIDKLAIVTAGLNYEEFCTDVKAFYPAMSLVAILGEAANQIAKVEVTLPDTIPWQAIRGIRNRVVHQYFDIDSQILWLVVSVEIPGLKAPLQELLNIYNAQGGNP
ncbi:MAG: HepT-like ribonuclease domain-containing protein [Microcoleaceae cyanobacterium]